MVLSVAMQTLTWTEGIILTHKKIFAECPRYASEILEEKRSQQEQWIAGRR